MFNLGAYPGVIRTSILILFSLLALLQHKLWFGELGVFQKRIVVHELEKKRNALRDLIRTNRTLKIQISSLKEDKYSYEGLARSELGMIKRGEHYIYAEKFSEPSEKH